MGVGNPSIISTKLVYEAISFYRLQGFEMTDVPMCVSKTAIDVTCPPGAPVLSKGSDYYVGSAEQSFIQMYLDGSISSGKYMALTPCHRVESRQDDLHFEMFLKLELMDLNPKSNGNASRPIYGIAENFFDSLGVTEDQMTIVNTSPREQDILIGGIEVGSYGMRRMPDGRLYLFGTGLAEPRTSYALTKVKK